MEDYISRHEHDEFCKRMEEEHRRQKERIKLLEENVRQIGALTVSVEKMACNMESMLQEQKEQGERLGALEEVPAKNWNTLKAGVLGAVAAAAGSGIVTVLINYL